jgi:hypothetical protein
MRALVTFQGVVGNLLAMVYTLLLIEFFANVVYDFVPRGGIWFVVPVIPFLCLLFVGCFVCNQPWMRLAREKIREELLSVPPHEQRES